YRQGMPLPRGFVPSCPPKATATACGLTAARQRYGEAGCPSVATVICYRRGCARMGRSGEVPFFFIPHARANVVNDNTPPNTSPRSLGVFEDRACQRLGNPWHARPSIEDQRSSFGRPWLRSDGERRWAR